MVTLTEALVFNTSLALIFPKPYQIPPYIREGYMEDMEEKDTRKNNHAGFALSFDPAAPGRHRRCCYKYEEDTNVLISK